MTLQDSPFPFDRPHSPVQREPYPSGRLPYSPSDTPLYGLNRGQFSRKGREMGEAFVYLWYDAGWKQTGGERYYIGKHKGTLDSGYICSSKYMKPEWEERGCKQKGCRHLFGEEGHHGDFHRRVLAYGDERDMIDFEVELLQRREHYFRTRYYNRTVVWTPFLSGEKHPAYKHGMSGTPEYQKQYYEQHTEELLLRSRIKYRDNKEAAASYYKQYYQQNKEKVKLQQKQYYQQNKEELASYQKQYYQQNKEKMQLQQKQYRERKKQEKLEGTLQLER